MPSALRRIATAVGGSNSACIEQGGAQWTTRHLRHHPQHADQGTCSNSLQKWWARSWFSQFHSFASSEVPFRSPPNTPGPMAPGLPCISRCRRSHHVTETAPAGGGFLLAASHSSCCTALGTGIAPTGSPSPWRWCRRYLLIDDVHRSSQLGCCCRCHGGPWRYRQLHVQARQGHCRRPTRSNAHQLSCCTTEHFGSLIARPSNQQNPVHAGFFHGLNRTD